MADSEDGSIVLPATSDAKSTRKTRSDKGQKRNLKAPEGGTRIPQKAGDLLSGSLLGELVALVTYKGERRNGRERDFLIPCRDFEHAARLQEAADTGASAIESIAIFVRVGC